MKKYSPYPYADAVRALHEYLKAVTGVDNADTYTDQKALLETWDKAGE